jgi:hypothetical protein
VNWKEDLNLYKRGKWYGLSGYVSPNSEDDAKYLFYEMWGWTTDSDDYGTLVCRNNFWYSCNKNNVKSKIVVDKVTYECKKEPITAMDMMGDMVPGSYRYMWVKS